MADSQRHVGHRDGRARLGDREIIVEFDIIDHPPSHHVRDPLAHPRFGIDDMVRAGPLQDATVAFVDGFCPDRRHAQIDQRRSRQHARLHIAGDADDGAGEIARAQLAQRFDIGGVGLNRMDGMVICNNRFLQQLVTIPAQPRDRRVGSYGFLRKISP